VSSELKTNKVSPATGTAFTLGDSGDTFTLPSGGTLTVASGATITNSGTATGFGGDNTPIVYVKKSSEQSSISSGVATKVSFDTEDIDTDSAFASDKFTVPSGEGGKYFLQGQAGIYSDGGTVSIAIAHLYKNGSLIDTDGSSSSNFRPLGTGRFTDITPTAMGIFELSASDYIELYVYITGSGTLKVRSNYTHLQVMKLVE